MEEKRLIEHLEDLRGSVIRALVGAAGGFAVSLVFVTCIFKILTRPYRDCLDTLGVSPDLALRSLGPADTLQITLKAALIFGLGLASPWIAYQIWKFVAPALYKNEKKYVVAFCASSVFCFIGGITFAFFMVLPTALSFFYTYTQSLGVTPDWAISNYYEFAVSFLVGFGLVFELPIAILILTLFGITSSKGLRAYRKHAVIGIFIVAGIFTPGPDIASQLMMGVPMLLLYEISILAARFIERGKKTVEVDEVDRR